MYPDPNRIRNNRLTVRVDAYEHALIVALANYKGEQVSTLIRQMVMQQASEILAVPHGSSVSERAA